MAEVNEFLSTLVASATSGVMLGVGAAINAWLSKRAAHSKDVGAASEKLRQLCKRLGVPEKRPEEIKTLDDVFAEIRRLNDIIDEREKK